MDKAVNEGVRLTDEQRLDWLQRNGYPFQET